MPLPTAPKVFVVDDDVSVRQSLEALIRWAGWEVAVFETAEDFLRVPRLRVPTCLILDVRLPDLSGLEVQARVAAHPHMPIIFITGHGDIPMTVRALKAGAVDFLTKPFDDDVLLEAIRHALERSRAALLREEEIGRFRQCYETLTKREREVMALVVSGLLNKQVGAELGTSEATIKAHRGQIMRKMSVGSFADLVRVAGELELAAQKH
jgi:FixJ family two-component response regulator